MGLGSLLDTAMHDVSLKKLIKARYASVEEVAYLQADSWIRSSAFPTMCPREEALCSRLKRTRKREISSDLQLIFDHGHGLHDRLQSHVLPTIGVMRGKWVCEACNRMQGGPVESGASVQSWAIPRPPACEACAGTKFRYHEVEFYNEEFRLTGHPDGFLELPDVPDLGILEGKSIKDGWQIENVPKLEHVLQLQEYLWLTDLKWGIVLYWIKGANGVGALVEHYIERDEGTIEAIKDTLRSIWESVAGGALPERLCPKSDCPRAQACPVREECFEGYVAQESRGEVSDESDPF